MKCTERLADTAKDEVDYIKLAYEFVRDDISHSADISRDTLPYSALKALKEGHGICFAKSHLFAALLRARSIPTDFCYQKLILGENTAPFLLYREVNGVWIKKYNKWIRLDARGNRSDVNAQFMIEREQPAFPIRTELGKKEIPIIYPEPDRNVLGKLKTCKTRTELGMICPPNLLTKNNGASFNESDEKRTIHFGQNKCQRILESGAKAPVPWILFYCP